jgi:Kef-type K+ transport system membrane component KefB
MRLGLFYVLILAAAVGLFLLIRAQGETLVAPDLGEAGGKVGRTTASAVDATPYLLLTLAAVIVLGRALGWLFRHGGQPPVVGEVIAGILLGPSVFGQLVPGGPAMLLPPEVAPYLREVAQLGVILYMFLVGLELNAGLLREKAHAAVAISHASIVVPFVLGAALALVLYPRLSHAGVPFTSFALFMGVAMAITAFPVLARILTDRGLSRTELGILALACAATDDVTAWCLLAFVVGVAQAEVQSALVVVLLSVAYLAAMFLVARPLLQRLAARCRGNDVPRDVVALVLVALLLSALATELIGIHALFGAFVLGAVIPHDSGLARVFTRRLGDLVTVLFLPAFFAFTGMRTQIGLLAGPADWLLCGLIIAVATAGKFGGTFMAAHIAGLPWRTGAALGALMNTRGLMELIVLNIALDLGVISPALFAMMVLMALATTVATTPALRLLAPAEAVGARPAVAADSAPG